MARNSSIYFGGLGGAALMYLLDPRSGRRRRAETRQKAFLAARETASAAEVVARDAANRSRGFAHRIANAFHADNASDDIIIERVRTALGRLTSHPGPISVTCRKGIVSLSGPVLSSEIVPLIAGLKLVRGVRLIENKLDLHSSDDHISALQGGRDRSLPGMFRLNWAPSTRFAVGTAGLGLLGYGLYKRGWLGWTLGFCGAGFFARSFVRPSGFRIDGRKAVDVQKSIYVNRPLEEVFSFFRRFENFPKFMSHVLNIEQLADNRWRWRVSGPAKFPVEWESEIVEFVPNELISWKSVEGATVKTSGFVRFLRDERGGTRINVHLHYAPFAGGFGARFAKLLGADPKRQMDDDLLRLKSLLETGKSGHFRQKAVTQRIAEEWQH